MNKPILILPALLLLAACGEKESEPANTAQDFAARINGGGKAQGATPGQATASPAQVAAPQANAAPGMMVPGTATDPNSATCSANAMGPFLGRVADDLTRSQVQQAATNASAIRFLDPGSEIIPDPASSRLNMLLDNTGIIRDAVCG